MCFYFDFLALCLTKQRSFLTNALCEWLWELWMGRINPPCVVTGTEVPVICCIPEPPCLILPDLSVWEGDLMSR